MAVLADAIDAATAEVMAAREQVCRAAWELTTPGRRDRLTQIEHFEMSAGVALTARFDGITVEPFRGWSIACRIDPSEQP